MHTHTVTCVHTHKHAHRTQLWDSSFIYGVKKGFVHVWKIKPRYFWHQETAERLDHYLEPAAESAVEMWVRGAGGLGSQDSLKPCYKTDRREEPERHMVCPEEEYFTAEQ